MGRWSSWRLGAVHHTYIHINMYVSFHSIYISSSSAGRTKGSRPTPKKKRNSSSSSKHTATILPRHHDDAIQKEQRNRKEPVCLVFLCLMSLYSHSGVLVGRCCGYIGLPYCRWCFFSCVLLGVAAFWSAQKRRAYHHAFLWYECWFLGVVFGWRLLSGPTNVTIIIIILYPR